MDDDPEEITTDDLTPEQRAWVPTAEEATSCWPHAWKVEVWDGAGVFYDYEGTWDWRSVALASRTYPGWWVVLDHPGRLTVHPSKEAGMKAAAKHRTMEAKYADDHEDDDEVWPKFP
jgi:hypothetical protein